MHDDKNRNATPIPPPETAADLQDPRPEPCSADVPRDTINEGLRQALTTAATTTGIIVGVLVIASMIMPVSGARVSSRLKLQQHRTDIAKATADAPPARSDDQAEAPTRSTP